MPYGDYLIIMGVGGFFLVLGVAAIIWGKSEEKSYYNSLSSRNDLREYMEHWPQRHEPGALKTGGWIAAAIGLVTLGMGGVFWLLG